MFSTFVPSSIKQRTTIFARKFKRIILQDEIVYHLNQTKLGMLHKMDFRSQSLRVRESLCLKQHNITYLTKAERNTYFKGKDHKVFLPFPSKKEDTPVSCVTKISHQLILFLTHLTLFPL